jgi:uncharacterized protein YkwD
VPNAHRLRAATLTLVSCLTLAFSTAPAVARGRRHARTVTATQQCSGSSAITARRRRRGHAGSCPANAHARRSRRLAQPSTAPTPTTTSTAASIAEVLSTTCQNTELEPETANLALVREAVLCLINRKRAESGDRPLIPSPLLEEAAEGHCQELISVDYFAHVSPSGETPVDRIRDTGYIPSPDDGYVIGENLAWGTYQLATAQSIASAWFASPEHLANILESQYRETGVAVTPAVPEEVGNGAPGATFAQEFGVIIP